MSYVWNCAIYDCSAWKKTPAVPLYTSNTERYNIVSAIICDRAIDNNLKMKIKIQMLHICRVLLLTWIFQYISNWWKAFELLPTLFHQHTESNKFRNFYREVTFLFNIQNYMEIRVKLFLFLTPVTPPTLNR